MTDERAKRQSANLARHLDDRYADTVLLLARHAAGRSDAVSASVIAAVPAGLTLAVRTADGEEQVQLPFPAGTTDVRAAVRELLRTTRAGLPADVPLTSLEAQQQSGASPHH